MVTKASDSFIKKRVRNSMLKKLIKERVAKVLKNGATVKHAVSAWLKRPFGIDLGCGTETKIKDVFDYYDKKKTPTATGAKAKIRSEGLLGESEGVSFGRRRKKSAASRRRRSFRISALANKHKARAEKNIKCGGCLSKQDKKMADQKIKEKSTKAAVLAQKIKEKSTKAAVLAKDTATKLAKKAATKLKNSKLAKLLKEKFAKAKTSLLKRVGDLVKAVMKDVSDSVTSTIKKELPNCQEPSLCQHCEPSVRKQFLEMKKYWPNMPYLWTNTLQKVKSCPPNWKCGDRCPETDTCLKTMRAAEDRYGTIIQLLIHRVTGLSWQKWDGIMTHLVAPLDSNVVVDVEACKCYASNEKECPCSMYWNSEKSRLKSGGCKGSRLKHYTKFANEYLTGHLDSYSPDKAITFRLKATDATSGKDTCVHRFALDTRYKIKKAVAARSRAMIKKCMQANFKGDNKNDMHYYCAHVMQLKHKRIEYAWYNWNTLTQAQKKMANGSRKKHGGRGSCATAENGKPGCKTKCYPSSANNDFARVGAFGKKMQCLQEANRSPFDSTDGIDCKARGGFVDRVIKGKLEKGGDLKLCQQQFIVIEALLRFFWSFYTATQTNVIGKPCMGGLQKKAMHKARKTQRNDAQKQAMHKARKTQRNDAMFMKGFKKALLDKCQSTAWSGPMMVVCSDTKGQVSQHKLAVRQTVTQIRDQTKMNTEAAGFTTVAAMRPMSVPGTTHWKTVSSLRFAKDGLRRMDCRKGSQCHTNINKAMTSWVMRDSQAYCTQTSITIKNSYFAPIKAICQKWDESGTTHAARLRAWPAKGGGCHVHPDPEAGRECAATCSPKVVPGGKQPYGQPRQPYEWRVNATGPGARFKPSSFGKDAAACVQQCDRSSLYAYTTASRIPFFSGNLHETVYSVNAKSWHFAVGRLKEFSGQGWLRKMFGPITFGAIRKITPYVCPRKLKAKDKNAAFCCKQGEQFGFATYRNVMKRLKAGNSASKNVTIPKQDWPESLIQASNPPSVSFRIKKFVDLYKQTCEATDTQASILSHKCKRIVQTIATKVKALVMNRKMSEIKKLVVTEARAMLKPENGCVAMLIQAMSRGGSSPSFQGCICSRYFSTILDNTYKIETSMPIRMNQFNPGIPLAWSPRQELQNVRDGSSHEAPLTEVGPLSFTLTRTVAKNGKPVCRMRITLDTRDCQTIPTPAKKPPGGRPWDDTGWQTTTACGCSGGLLVRKVRTEQVTLHAGGDHGCGQWFVIMDAWVRSIYSLFTALVSSSTRLRTCPAGH